MPPAVPVEAHETITNEDGKILERSQEDGELYSKPTIGIIYPPPEVRNIVDRTANFVARNGPEFEDRIRGNEAENPKFNFLNPNDPYNAYYENKLKEFREGDLSEPVGLATQMKDIIKPAAQPKQNLEIIETIVPKDPPTPYEYVCDPPTISAIDLDLVKLTAQFVAKNGKGFLTNLMNREQRNYQFDFLRPQHSLFQYFTKLVEQYTKILLPSNDIVETLSKDTKNPWKVLDRVNYRVEWQRYQDREKQKIEDEKERERVAYAQIDWHDFVVVETVNFRETETANLPPPVSKDQLGSRILQQERIDKLKDGEGGEATSNMAAGDQVEMDVENEEEEQLYEPSSRDNDDDQTKQDSDMDEASDEEDNTPNQPPLPPPVAPPGAGANVTIRKNYDPKSKPSAPSTSVQDGFMISPLTGEKVPIESMAAHMKISLLDPRWKEQKERALEEKKQQEQVFAEGVHIGDTLKQLAERRSDIFGVGAEETLIGRKLGEEEEQMKVTKEIWDGHTASMERATKLAHSNITFEDQIKAIHRAKGLLPSEGAEKIGPSVPEKSYGHAVSQQPPIVIPPPLPKMTQPPAPKPLPKESDIVSSSQPPPHSTSSVTATPMPPPAAPPTAPPRPPNMPQAPLLGQPPIRPPPLLPPPGLLLPPQQGPPQHGQFLPMPMSDGSQGLILPPPSSADDDGPLMKKQKLDTEADLMSEQEYLQKNTSPVTFRVQVPEIPEKSDWQCQGQVLQITLPLTDQCSVVKAKIFEMIDMPAGKQKLQLGTFFIKDSNSLAYYNFSSTTLLHLQLKERGGRKK